MTSEQPEPSSAVAGRRAFLLTIGQIMAATALSTACAAREQTAGVQMAAIPTGDRRMRVEAFLPVNARPPVPAVILLHGASGIGRGAYLYPTAESLRDNGIAAFVLHYFDGLDVRAKSSPAHYEARDRLLEDALSYVARRPQVDASRIGLYGLSLGGFHALGLACRDERIKAVASVGGAMSVHLMREGIRRMPPTLFLHGERDTVVPLSRVRELTRLLDRAGMPYEMHVYPRQGHSFSAWALEDSVRRVTAFYQQHLLYRSDLARYEPPPRDAAGTYPRLTVL